MGHLVRLDRFLQTDDNMGRSYSLRYPRCRQLKESVKEQQWQRAPLRRELAAVTGGLGRFYEGIEMGIIKRSDTLRERSDQLQTQRRAVLTDIAAAKTKTPVPAHVLHQKHIDAFTRLLREKLSFPKIGSL